MNIHTFCTRLQIFGSRGQWKWIENNVTQANISNTLLACSYANGQLNLKTTTKIKYFAKKEKNNNNNNNNNRRKKIGKKEGKDGEEEEQQ